jgi:hypothetical protein
MQNVNNDSILIFIKNSFYRKRLYSFGKSVFIIRHRKNIFFN